MARLSTSAGSPTILPFTVAASRSAGQKSFHLNEGSLAIRSFTSATLGLLTMFAIHEPKRYVMSGGLPPAMAVRVFWRASVSYTHLRAHETRHDLVCRLLLEKKKK